MVDCVVGWCDAAGWFAGFISVDSDGSAILGGINSSEMLSCSSIEPLEEAWRGVVMFSVIVLMYRGWGL
jgi:hypothetical protein